MVRNRTAFLKLEGWATFADQPLSCVTRDCIYREGVLLHIITVACKGWIKYCSVFYWSTVYSYSFLRSRSTANVALVLNPCSSLTRLSNPPSLLLKEVSICSCEMPWRQRSKSTLPKAEYVAIVTAFRKITLRKTFYSYSWMNRAVPKQGIYEKILLGRGVKMKSAKTNNQCQHHNWLYRIKVVKVESPISSIIFQGLKRNLLTPVMVQIIGRVRIWLWASDLENQGIQTECRPASLSLCDFPWRL